MKPEPITRINLAWYAVTLVPIAVLFYLSATGVLPALGLLLALFFAMFWLFSFLFALYVLWRRRKTAK